MSDWLLVNPTSGVNNYNLTVNATSNQQLSARTGYIRVYNELYNIDDYCMVTQDERTAENITITPSSVSGDYTGKDITVSVSTIGSWNAVSSLNIVPNSGYGDTTVTITIPENATLEQTSYTATFLTQDDSASFTYHQSGVSPSDNQIFYITDTNELMVDINTSAADWGANITSHEYDNYGIIEFDAPINKIAKRAFFYQDGYRHSGVKQYPAPVRYLLPSSVTTIDREAFFCNTSLSKINIGGITWFGDSAFTHCSLSDTSMHFSSKLTLISPYAFSGTYMRRPISFRNCTGLTAIQQYAFYNAYVRNLTFPSQSIYLGNHAFANFNAGSADAMYSYCKNPRTVDVSVFENHSKSGYRGTLYVAGGDYSTWRTSLNTSGSGWIIQRTL